MQDLNLSSDLPQAGLFCPLGPNRCLSTSPGVCRAGHTKADNCSLISRYLTLMVVIITTHRGFPSCQALR